MIFILFKSSFSQKTQPQEAAKNYTAETITNSFFTELKKIKE